MLLKGIFLDLPDYALSAITIGREWPIVETPAEGFISITGDVEASRSEKKANLPCGKGQSKILNENGNVASSFLNFVKLLFAILKKDP